MARKQLACPNCGLRAGRVVDRKAWITTLIECDHCGLLYRAPTDTTADNRNFYQAEYHEGFTTDCPDAEELQRLKKSNFAGKAGDYSTYIEVLNHLGVSTGTKIFEFGCSWGYGSYQLMQAGFEVVAFDVSRKRCAYAVEKLGVDATSNLSEVNQSFDLFFSAHVLEHVPDLQETIRLARAITKPGGLFLNFTPNGSATYRERNWRRFHRSWGLTHPNFLQDTFYQNVFPDSPYLLASASPAYPLEQLSGWNRGEHVVHDMSGWELMAAVVL